MVHGSKWNNDHGLQRYLEVERCFREFTVSHFIGMPSKKQLFGTVPSTGTENQINSAGNPASSSKNSLRKL